STIYVRLNTISIELSDKIFNFYLYTSWISKPIIVSNSIIQHLLSLDSSYDGSLLVRKHKQHCKAAAPQNGYRLFVIQVASRPPKIHMVQKLTVSLLSSLV